MKSIQLILCTAFCLFLKPAARATDVPTARLLRRALDAQGGEAALRAIHTMRYAAYGYRNLLEQSERPEGPYFVSFANITTVFDFDHQRFFERRESATYPVEKSARELTVDKDAAMISVGKRQIPGAPEQVKIAEETTALSPARLLLTALDTPDTHLSQDVILQSVPQHVIEFHLDGVPVTIYLNAYTNLPTAMDFAGPAAQGDYGKFLGGVTQRTYYSLWWLAKGGVHLPMQWNTEVNGMPERMTVIDKLQINDAIQPEELTIPAEIRAKFHARAVAPDLNAMPLGIPGESASELSSGVVLIPGYWNVTLIRQEDGVVVLEAPISSGYSEKVIAEAHRRFPGVPVKAVITTSDSWPHLAGIRQYVAEGIPVYSLNLNEPILRRFLAMPYTAKPDALRRSPRAAKFHLVEAKTVIGTGENRLEIYPIRGQTGERQVMVYFPQHHLLYGSDLFQQMPDGAYFYPQTVSELLDAVLREHLKVDCFFMMHMGSTPWSGLAEVVDASKKSDSPAGVQ